ncbi:MAG: hypothetical protein LBK70_00460 [Clostridiales bacterium]|jgi:hypothetical protein|nr:hypothetical protein [Clostridiales bacterium]
MAKIYKSRVLIVSLSLVVLTVAILLVVVTRSDTTPPSNDIRLQIETDIARSSHPVLSQEQLAYGNIEYQTTSWIESDKVSRSLFGIRSYAKFDEYVVRIYKFASNISLNAPIHRYNSIDIFLPGERTIVEIEPGEQKMATRLQSINYGINYAKSIFSDSSDRIDDSLLQVNTSSIPSVQQHLNQLWNLNQPIKYQLTNSTKIDWTNATNSDVEQRYYVRTIFDMYLIQVFKVNYQFSSNQKYIYDWTKYNSYQYDSIDLVEQYTTWDISIPKDTSVIENSIEVSRYAMTYGPIRYTFLNQEDPNVWYV